MDVKVKDTQVNKEGAKASTPILQSSRQRDLKPLLVSQVSIPTEAVTLEMKPPKKSHEQRELRARINNVISTINVASETTAEVKKLIKSIDGITLQAQGDISDERRTVLENEARGLVAEIKKRAGLALSAPVQDKDQVRLEIEKTLGETLEALFPAGARDAFGIEAIAFTPKENIISVRTSVEVAQRRLEELSQAIENTKHQVKAVIDNLEVAAQNTEAADTTIRDVDAALKLAAHTKSVISANPRSALESVGRISRTAEDLLDS